MSTSKPVPPGGGNNNGGNGNGGNVPNSYTRFIPREELGSFAAWNPQTFEQPTADKGDPAGESGVRKQTFSERAAASVPLTVKPTAGAGTAAKPAPASAKPAAATARPAPKPAPKATVTSIKRQPLVGGMPGEEAPPPPEPPAPPEPTPNVEELIDKAHKSGYQDGYRNGLIALESYKQTQAAQLAAYMNDQIGALASDFHHRLESLEQQLAGRIAGVALELARQVVRSELDQRPEAVLTVAEEALSVLLSSAKQIVVRLNPDDNALAQGSLTEVLQARGARLLPDSAVTRGGCVVESDIAVVDASVEARWFRAAAAMGSQTEWHGGHEVPYTPVDNGDSTDMDDELPSPGDAA
ncbi:MAG: flagellar assembly protein FliH [Aquabacterium sp.]|uniref:FliH/SctL family protein n=1 Tax=Aquabacterium sp. TaxID=1872578 RepID=UPI00271F681B|nr:flagellar assembly protein FliH [Aquabacterium sp.]MDO9004615.1 flagellar assembly protein FliH [Aquabacterium sp.]